MSFDGLWHNEHTAFLIAVEPNTTSTNNSNFASWYIIVNRINLSSHSVEWINLCSHSVEWINLCSHSVEWINLCAHSVEWINLCSHSVEWINLCSHSVEWINLCSHSVEWSFEYHMIVHICLLYYVYIWFPRGFQLIATIKLDYCWKWR